MENVYDSHASRILYTHNKKNKDSSSNEKWKKKKSWIYCEWGNNMKNVYVFHLSVCNEAMKNENEHAKKCSFWTKKTFNMTWIMSKRIMGKSEVREIPIQILDSRTIETMGDRGNVM